MREEILSARKFLAHHFRNASGLIEFRLIGNGKSIQSFFSPEEAESQWPDIEERLKRANRSGANIYFGVNPRTDKAGDAAHVPAVDCLWVDIDHKGDLVRKNSEILKAYHLEPNVVIDSGRGWHFYWYLSEPVSYAEAEPVLKKLIRVLAADVVAFDAPRIMRLPGFLNRKYDPPLLCSVVKYDHVREFNLDNFDPLDTAAPGAYPEGKEPGKGAAAPARKFEPSKLTLETYGNGHGFAYSMAQGMSRWWREGHRHQLAVGLAGLLRKDEITEEGALLIVQKVCEMAQDQELEDRLTAVRTTYAEPDINKVKSSEAIKQIFKEDDAKEFFSEYNRIFQQLPPPPIFRKKLPDFPLYECIPAGSVFDKYVFYASERTDAPVQYHVASILSVAAAALGNSVWINWFSDKKLFPNLYTLLVGPSSRFRKSTSITTAKRVGRQGGVTTYPNNATVEALYAKLAPEEEEVEWEHSSKPGVPPKKKVLSWKGTPAGIIYHSEFSNWLSTSAKSYMQEARAFFTDLYDGDMDRDSGSRETKTSGKYHISDPAISLLCGVTPASMKEFVTKIDSKNGFLPRFLVIMHPPNHENRFGLPKRRAEDVDAMMEFAQAISDLGKVSGEMGIALECEETFVAFQKFANEKIRGVEKTPLAILDGFYNRLVTMAGKLSMIFAASEGRTIIEKRDMEYATNLCRYSAEVLSHFFDEIKPDDGNREMKYAEQVLKAARALVEKHQLTLIPHRQLLQNSNVNADQFKKAVETLKERGELWPQPKPGGRGIAYLLREVER